MFVDLGLWIAYSALSLYPFPARGPQGYARKEKMREAEEGTQ